MPPETPPATKTPSVHVEERVADVLRDTLAYSRNRDYTGWDYCDGMSSRFRQWLPFESKWVNIAIQESAKRAPINVRPLLLVEQRRNFMGSGLFAMANMTADQLLTGQNGNGGTGNGVDYPSEAMELLDWLIENRCRGYSGFCGSHMHEVQNLTGKDDPARPSVVSTVFPTMALLRAGDLDPIYPAIGRTAGDFVVEDLDYQEVSTGATIEYRSSDFRDFVIPNAVALGGQLLAELYAVDGDEAVADRATALLEYVADRQSDCGGWMYSDPPEASHLSMDNFHNGFIIEALLRYSNAVDGKRFADVIDRALAFYEGMFEADGAPHWDETAQYPRDIHAVAQGILVFTYAGDHDRATRILSWALDNMYAGDGRFYYRKHRLFTKRVTLMRWCQAWMAYALSEYLRHTVRDRDSSERRLTVGHL